MCGPRAIIPCSMIYGVCRLTTLIESLLMKQCHLPYQSQSGKIVQGWNKYQRKPIPKRLFLTNTRKATSARQWGTEENTT
jgi:hypothetical protein